MTLNKLRDICHSNAVTKGFYSSIFDITLLVQDNLGIKQCQELKALISLSRLMLINTELSEMAEGIRKPQQSNHIPDIALINEELADVLIRCFDLAGYLNIDLDSAVQRKMEFNANREQMHGGKLA